MALAIYLILGGLSPFFKLGRHAFDAKAWLIVGLGKRDANNLFARTLQCVRYEGDQGQVAHD